MNSSRLLNFYALISIAVAPYLATAVPEYSVTTVFTSGDGYHTYRIPAIVKANDGTLLAFCEGRASTSDLGDIDIVLKRSSDNGLTWGSLSVVQSEGTQSIGNPAPVVDRTTGHIHLLFTRENDTVFHTVSTDNGLTWSVRIEITANVKRPEWGWYATGPCHGVQLTRGNQAGRLVVPANHRIGADGSDSGSFGAQIIYSDDNGATWHMDAYTEEINGAAPNETTLVELNTPGTAGGSHLYINSRDYGSDPGTRSEAYSGDGGSSYSVAYNGNAHFVTPIVQGSLVRFSATDEGDATNRIIFSCPNGGSRSNGSLWTSTDETNTWSQPKLLLAGAYAYSDMTKTASGHLGVFAETDNYGNIKFIRVNEEWLDVPPPPAENPSGAFWNFEEKASGNTADTTTDAIQDIGPDNNQRHLTADAAFSYITGSPSYSGNTALTFADNGGLSIPDSETDNNFDFAAGDSFTIEAAFRSPNGTSNTGAIVAKDLGANQPSWWLRVESAGHVRFLVSDNSSEALVSTGTTIVNDGNWHTVVAVKDGTNDRLKIYLNGTLIANVADTTTGSHANAQALCIGRFNASGRDFIGDIDFVRITPSALAPAQFVTTHTQLDADADAIPDTYERSLAGDLNTLGTGDQDSDGSSDLLEYALGSMPTDASSVPATSMSVSGANSYSFTHIQRKLPAWLTLSAEFSSNLQTWDKTIPNASISTSTSPIDAERDTYTHTITPTSGDLPSIFAQLILTSSQ